MILCCAGLLCCNKTEDATLKSTASKSETKASAKTRLTVTIRGNFFREREGTTSSYSPFRGESYGVGYDSKGNMMEIWLYPDISMPGLGGWTYGSQMWAEVKPDPLHDRPTIAFVSLTLQDVYIYDSGNTATVGPCSVAISFRDLSGYSDTMPVLKTESSYIDEASLKLIPEELNEQYDIVWNVEGLPVHEVPKVRPVDPDPDPEPFDSTAIEK